MARSIALAHTGIEDKNTREADDGHQAMPAARAVCIAVYDPGEEDLESLRPILAELGVWVVNTTDFCGMGIKDPKGKSWHTYDWGSSDGVPKNRTYNRVSIWVPEDQAPLRSMDVTRGPYEAWQGIKNIPRTR
jgi:hypothetical protein